MNCQHKPIYQDANAATRAEAGAAAWDAAWAAWAARAARAAAGAERGKEAVDTIHGDPIEGVETNAVDTIADILHHVEACGGDTVAVMYLARKEFEGELGIAVEL